MNKRFALKVTYTYTHNFMPPTTAQDKTDTTTQVYIVYNLS
nr:DUF481 domain-containing protein [Pantoea sp. JGM49]